MFGLFYDLCWWSLCWFWTFGIAVSDYYQFDELLTPEEQALRKKIRECMEKEVAPIMAKVFTITKIFIFSVLLSTFSFFKMLLLYDSFILNIKIAYSLLFFYFIFCYWAEMALSLYTFSLLFINYYKLDSFGIEFIYENCTSFPFLVLGEGRISIWSDSKARCVGCCWWHN